MLIDLHVHSAISRRAGLDPEAIIERARQVGLDAVVFTERDSSAGTDELLDLSADLAFPIFLGVELATDRGHLLCYPAELDAFWHEDGWLTSSGTLRRAEEIVTLFTQRGGAVVMAHPYDRPARGSFDPLLKMRGLAAIEVLNGRRRPALSPAALRAADLMKLPGVGGSDVHDDIDPIGRAATLVRAPVRTQEDLAEALRHGDLWPLAIGESDPVAGVDAL